MKWVGGAKPHVAVPMPSVRGPDNLGRVSLGGLAHGLGLVVGVVGDTRPWEKQGLGLGMLTLAPDDGYVPHV